VVTRGAQLSYDKSAQLSCWHSAVLYHTFPIFCQVCPGDRQLQFVRSWHTHPLPKTHNVYTWVCELHGLYRNDVLVMTLSNDLL
jgi:hypothetical protein